MPNHRTLGFVEVRVMFANERSYGHSSLVLRKLNASFVGDKIQMVNDLDMHALGSQPDRASENLVLLSGLDMSGWNVVKNDCFCTLSENGFDHAPRVHSSSIDCPLFESLSEKSDRVQA